MYIESHHDRYLSDISKTLIKYFSDFSATLVVHLSEFSSPKLVNWKCPAKFPKLEVSHFLKRGWECYAPFDRPQKDLPNSSFKILVTMTGS